ncbi:MAG: Ig-like domain-containing protein [Acidobacteriota bacterium]|nr:Ig-like domain-containing protein [Acidobacteriota bacterium]MDQ5871988.1 Ig-like domain-containing protein [Acidobacteriota bacterium]
MKAIPVLRVALCLLALAFAPSCSRKPASVQVTPGKVVLYGVERGQRLTAQLFDQKGQPLEEGPKATWTSSKPGVAAVDEGGRVVSKSSGNATITVAFGSVSAEVPVEVVDAALIEVLPGQATLVGPAGTELPVAAVVKSSKAEPVALPLTWASSDPKVVTVSPQGRVTSVGNGKATVTARVGELQGAVEVTVLVQDIARLEVRPSTALVRVGDSQRFEVVAVLPDGSRFENAMAQFRSSNPSVATIDGGGVASGVGPGSATIRVDLAGQTAEATLIVN